MRHCSSYILNCVVRLAFQFLFELPLNTIIQSEFHTSSASTAALLVRLKWTKIMSMSFSFLKATRRPFSTFSSLTLYLSFFASICRTIFLFLFLVDYDFEKSINKYNQMVRKFTRCIDTYISYTHCISLFAGND